jgi:hypothetical protein
MFDTDERVTNQLETEAFEVLPPRQLQALVYKCSCTVTYCCTTLHHVDGDAYISLTSFTLLFRIVLVVQFPP